MVGLKENLMIGKPIPAGTGYRTFKDVKAVDTVSKVEENNEVDESVKKFFEENDSNELI